MSDLNRMRQLAGIHVTTLGNSAHNTSQVDEAKFSSVSCSQCGSMFGQGDSGFSHCKDHAGQKPIDESALSEMEDMHEGNPPIDKRTMGKLNKQVNDKKWATHKASDEKDAKDAEAAKKQPTPVEEDLNNGYADLKFMDANDFFPDGADSPVTSRAGPSGARHGDNPEQKKMEVAEAHKELVYNYRKFIKEAARK